MPSNLYHVQTSDNLIADWFNINPVQEELIEQREALLEFFSDHLPAPNALIDLTELTIGAIQVLSKTQTKWNEAGPNDYNKKKTRFLSMYDMLRYALKNRDGLLQQLHMRIKRRLQTPKEPDMQKILVTQHDKIIKSITDDIDTLNDFNEPKTTEDVET